MRIELRYGQEGERRVCVVCGEDFTREQVAACVCLPDEGLSRAVCMWCVKSGEEGIRQRMSRRAENLRYEAKRLERALRAELHVPTLEDIHALERLRPHEFSPDIPMDDEPF